MFALVDESVFYTQKRNEQYHPGNTDLDESGVEDLKLAFCAGREVLFKKQAIDNALRTSHTGNLLTNPLCRISRL